MVKNLMQGIVPDELRQISPSEPKIFSEIHESEAQAVRQEIKNRKTRAGVRLMAAKID